MPSTESPTASTRPTPSTPRILGLETSVQAMPCRTPMSMKLTPARVISTNASPGPATGSGSSTHSSISRPPVPFITIAFIDFAPILNDRSVIGQKRLSQCPQRHVGQAGYSRPVGAAAPGDANASDVSDQRLGDRFGVKARGDITLPLCIANACGDGSAQASCQQRIDLLEVGTGGAELID